jgi:hypothetical protein
MNWRLDNPPTVDVSVSRHMGLFAVARLAERHRVRVRLRPAQPQGLSALVWLPDSVIERTTGGYGTAGWQSLAVGSGPAASSTAGGRRLAAGPAEGSVALAQNGHSVGNGNGNAIGVGNAASADGPRVAQGLFRGGETAAEPADGPRAAQGLFRSGEAVAESAPQWSAPATPSYDDRTAAGLPVRTRKPGQEAGSDGGGAELPRRSDFARGGPPPGRGPGTSSQQALQRSPDQIRSRLAGFQRGTRRAETQQAQSPRAGEGSER